MEQEQSQATEVRAVGRGLFGEQSLPTSGKWGCCWRRCTLPDTLSISSASGGGPARNELQNFEMLIRQRSLASEPFPWGSYSGALYS